MNKRLKKILIRELKEWLRALIIAIPVIIFFATIFLLAIFLPNSRDKQEATKWQAYQEEMSTQQNKIER